MAPVERPVISLYDPNGVPNDAIGRPNLSDLIFDFKEVGGTNVLETNPLETRNRDPWGVLPIQFFRELLCVHLPSVLIRIRSTDRRYRTLFFVYTSHFPNGANTVVELPKVAPEIWASQSFGLVHSSDSNMYVVANLQSEYNQVTEQVEVFLHRWLWSGSSWKSNLNDKVALPLRTENYMEKWKPHQVITFMDDLLWVDLSQGVILRCKKPSQNFKAKFDFIGLPFSEKGPRPQTFMSVGCCNGELKVVKIDHTSDVNTVYVTIMTFNESSYEKDLWKYWDMTSINSKPLICGKVWAAMKSTLQLPSNWNELEYHMPCFPVLDRYKDNILHLTMARKDNMGAWLLQVNTQSFDLEGAVDYPGFRNHQKPPYS